MKPNPKRARNFLAGYLAVAALAETVLLLMAGALARDFLHHWRYQDPEKQFRFVTEISPIIPKYGFVIPLILILFSIRYWSGRTRQLKVGIHALGLSFALTAFLVIFTITASLMPGVDATFSGFGDSPDSVSPQSTESPSQPAPRP